MNDESQTWTTEIVEGDRPACTEPHGTYPEAFHHARTATRLADTISIRIHDPRGCLRDAWTRAGYCTWRHYGTVQTLEDVEYQADLIDHIAGRQFVA